MALIAGWIVLLHSCSSTIAFRTLCCCCCFCFVFVVVVNLVHRAVETAISEVHKLLCTGRVPTSLAFGLERLDELFISTRSPHPPPPFPVPNKPYGFCGRKVPRKKDRKKLRPAKAEEIFSYHQNNRCKGCGDLASAKQLVYSATCSFNSCAEQSRKDRARTSSCSNLKRCLTCCESPAPSPPC